MKSKIAESLASYVDALYPILYINHFDFKVIDNIIESISEDVYCVEFNNAFGKIDFKTKSPICKCNLISFLENEFEDSFEIEKKYKIYSEDYDFNNLYNIITQKK